MADATVELPIELLMLVAGRPSWQFNLLSVQCAGYWRGIGLDIPATEDDTIYSLKRLHLQAYSMDQDSRELQAVSAFISPTNTYFWDGLPYPPTSYKPDSCFGFLLFLCFSSSYSQTYIESPSFPLMRHASFNSL